MHAAWLVLGQKSFFLSVVHVMHSNILPSVVRYLVLLVYYCYYRFQRKLALLLTNLARIIVVI